LDDLLTTLKRKFKTLDSSKVNQKTSKPQSEVKSMMTPIKEDRYENKGRNNDVEIRMSIESQKSVSPRLPPKKENSSPLLEDARKNANQSVRKSQEELVLPKSSENTNLIVDKFVKTDFIQEEPKITNKIPPSIS